jgi:hypothetical protein
MPLAAWIVGLAGPIVTRVLAQLAIGYVTFKGLDIAISALLSSARSAWAGMGGDIAAFVAMSGLNTSVSIIAGAVVARVAMIPLKRLRPK